MRDDLGRWVTGTSGNVGGRPKPPDGLRARLADLSPIAIERLGELLDSPDERVRLEAAKAILDRHLGRPAIQADISLHRAEQDGHLAALLAVARRRALEPIVLEDVEVRGDRHRAFAAFALTAGSPTLRLLSPPNVMRIGPRHGTDGRYPP